MTPLTYLRDIILSLETTLLSHPGTKKVYHKATRILCESGVWRTNLPTWVSLTEDTITRAHRVSLKSRTPIKLTKLSIEIGKQISYELGLPPTTQTHLSIGNLFLESFLQAETISIKRDSSSITSPYIVEVLGESKLRPALSATYFTKPKEITSLRNPQGKPYIKGWTDSTLFTKLISSKPVWFSSLNKLQQSPWKINQEVLKVLLSNPPPKEVTITNPSGEKESVSIFGPFPEGHWKLNGQRFKKEKDTRISSMRSSFYEWSMVTSKATFIGDREFYQGYTLDWRGRSYCSESYLEFLGSDLSRGLFLFGGEGSTYTQEGISALKIHIANSIDSNLHKDSIPTYLSEDYKTLLEKEGLETISLSKLTKEDRVRWVDNNQGLLTTTSLSDKAENPVAFLAGCIELSNIYKDPLFKGNLPIPVDGSNSALQHLSAITRDPSSSDLVSMTPQKFQKDFYVVIAKEMIRLEPKWFSTHNIPMKDIRKGISKRGSMVRFYSAGVKRIEENMKADCDNFGFSQKYKLTEEDFELLSKTLVKAVKNVCPGPLNTMSWLQTLVGSHIEEGNEDFRWVTPSGFPAIFTSYQDKDNSFKGLIRGVGEIHHIVKEKAFKRIKSGDEWILTEEPLLDRKGFAKGISPNVVHSYDASHLSLTVVSFPGQLGVVHDSFSSHGNDQEELIKTLKETFKEIYDIPNWFQDFQTRAGINNPLPSHPEVGTYDFKSLDDSTYFFS